MTGRFPPSAQWPVLIIRRERVMLDEDLAGLFGVSTEEIGERVKRNRKRFPENFMFRLTAAERDELAAVCRRLRKLKFSRTPPLAFTKTGALMLAGVLESPQAAAMSVEIIRDSIRARGIVTLDQDLARKLDEIEGKYDAQTKEVFDAIRQLMEPPPERPRPRIGFGA